MPCGKVQDQRDFTGMSKAIPKNDVTPGLWFPAENISTFQYFCMKDVHLTAPNMERADFMMRKYSPIKDISRSNIGGGGHMVVQLCSVVNI